MGQESSILTLKHLTTVKLPRTRYKTQLRGGGGISFTTYYYYGTTTTKAVL